MHAAPIASNHDEKNLVCVLKKWLLHLLHMNFVMNHDCADTIRHQGELYLKKIEIQIQRLKTIFRQMNQGYENLYDRRMQQAKGPT